MIEHKTNAQLQKCIIQLSKRLEEAETKLIELEKDFEYKLEIERNLNDDYSNLIQKYLKRVCKLELLINTDYIDKVSDLEINFKELEEHTKRNLKICFSQIGHFEKRECRIMDRLIKVEKEVEE